MIPLAEWHYQPFFTPHELACKGSGKLITHPGFMEALVDLRKALNELMSVNSGCRSQDHNVRVGGHHKSLHICDAPQHEGQRGTLAVDIHAMGPYRGRLFALAWKMGWSIGWGKRFLHLDRRDFLGMDQTTFDY